VLTASVTGVAAVDSDSLSALPPSVTVVRSHCPLGGATQRGAPNPERGSRRVLRELGRRLSRLIFVPDRQVLWAPGAVRAGMRALRENQHEVVVASHGPGTSLIVGRRLAALAGLPLVVDFRDLWADLVTGDFPTRWHRAAAERWERAAVAASRKVVAVSAGMAEHLARRHGRSSEDVVAIPNGFDPADAELVADTRKPGERPFRLCYLGSVYGAYDFGPFFEALAGLARDGRVTAATLRVEFVGNLSPEVPRRYGIEQLVEIGPFVPHRRILEVLGRADAHLVLENPIYWSQLSYPAKVFDYLLTGKPILSLVVADGNSGRLVREAGVGVVVAPDDSEGIARALLGLMARKGEQPRPVHVERPPLLAHNRRHLARRMAGVLDRAVGRAG
jgi:glycosyltransferase involved in cell wall biosynthesis